jgi:hypothetical protein
MGHFQIFFTQKPILAKNLTRFIFWNRIILFSSFKIEQDMSFNL